jgi:ribosomal protein S1
VQAGQTVVTSIISHDSASGRFDISLKASKVSLYQGPSSLPIDVSYLSSLFQEQDMIQLHSSGAERTNEKSWSSFFKLGSVVKSTVRQRAPYGVILDVHSIDENIKASGLVTADGSSKSGGLMPCSVGDVVTTRIVDADMGKKILDLKFVPDGEPEAGPADIKKVSICQFFLFLMNMIGS